MRKESSDKAKTGNRTGLVNADRPVEECSFDSLRRHPGSSFLRCCPRCGDGSLSGMVKDDWCLRCGQAYHFTDLQVEPPASAKEEPEFHVDIMRKFAAACLVLIGRNMPMTLAEAEKLLAEEPANRPYLNHLRVACDGFGRLLGGMHSFVEQVADGEIPRWFPSSPTDVRSSLAKKENKP